MSDERPPILSARGVGKSFPGVVALQDVDFDVRLGEVHALLGENGAGKSTLTRIIAGDYPPDEGELAFDGEPVQLTSPRDALDLGVRLVTQERALVPTLSVAENVLLGRLPRGRGGHVDWRRTTELAREALGRAGLDVDPRIEAGRLRQAEQQLLEIAKALSGEGRILILDEPTAALSSAETERLFDVVRGLRDEGVGIVYISHRVGELASIVDRVTVLRDGRVVHTAPFAQTDREDLVRMMVGRELTELYPRVRSEPTDELLRVEGVSHEGVCEDVSLEVRRGEIVIVFGLVGSGAIEVPYMVAGHMPHSGAVKVAGRAGFVPADRHAEGLLPQATIRRNIGVASLSRYATLGVFSRRRERAAAMGQIRALALRPPRPEGPVAKLSGGNQQKAVLGRWLTAGADVLVLAEPTRGVDIGARAEIYELLGRLCEGGAAVFAASSDLDEVVGLADRVYVMSRGRVVAHFEGADVRHEQILEAATR
ncbi:MAG TPA: sugar ABC transporter ATP-binding protein [Solirubrobacteraceae bacterium]|nr:sugar ABC transporter ATP-binding protein [Solirubrobacteraceae bacterium]